MTAESESETTTKARSCRQVEGMGGDAEQRVVGGEDEVEREAGSETESEEMPWYES